MRIELTLAWGRFALLILLLLAGVAESRPTSTPPQVVEKKYVIAIEPINQDCIQFVIYKQGKWRMKHNAKCEVLRPEEDFQE